jgi:prophage antirepressor-like protein
MSTLYYIDVQKNIRKMSEIKIFKSPLFGQVRIVNDVSNEPLFCLGDVCKALGLRTGDVRIRLDKGVVSTQPLATTGGVQKATFVNEDGLYDVILDSRKPQAKAFRKWLTSEVIPSIRKTGGYIATQQEDTPESIMARALKIADETLKRHRQRVCELEIENRQQSVAIEQKNAQIEVQQKELTVAAPKVRYYDDTLASVDYVTTQQIANEIGMNANVLSKKLEEVGVLYSQSKQWLLKMPYKTWNLHGTRTFPFIHSDGTKGSRVYTVWNQRGRRFIIALKNNGFNLKAAIKDLKIENNK